MDGIRRSEVTVSDTLEAYVSYDLKNEFDLIVQVWTMGTIQSKQEKALLEAVKSGVGLAGWHGGLGDSFRNNTEYQFMVGGQWVGTSWWYNRLQGEHHRS